MYPPCAQPILTEHNWALRTPLSHWDPLAREKKIPLPMELANLEREAKCVIVNKQIIL